MTLLNDAFLMGLRGVGKGVVRGGQAGLRGAGRAVGLIPGGSGLVGKTVGYAGRHAISGTTVGGMGLEMVGKTPITRHVANVGGAVAQGSRDMAGARQGDGASDPNAPNEVQRRRLGMKQASTKRASMTLREAANALRAGYTAQDVRAGMTRPNIVPTPSPVTGSANQGEVDMFRLEEVLKQAQAQGVYSGGLEKSAAFGAALATAAATALVGAGAQTVSNAYRGHVAEKTWSNLIGEHKGFNNAKHRENFEVIKRYSPDLAANKTVLRSYLTRMDQMDQVPLEMVDGMVGTQRSRDDGNLAMTGARQGVQSFGTTLGQGLNKNREQRNNRLQEKARENRGEIRKALNDKDYVGVAFSESNPRRAVAFKRASQDSPLLASYDAIDQALASVNVSFDRE